MAEKSIDRKALVNFGRNRAIIIGIDSYAKINNGSLTTPVNDAEAFRDVLIRYQGFDETDISLLCNPDKEALEKLLQRLKAENPEGAAAVEPSQETDEEEPSEEETPADLSQKGCLIFYYAGHGVAGDLEGEGPAGYILPSDAEMQSCKLSENTSLLAMEVIFHALEALNYHHTLLILDCCFAGAFRRIQTTRATFGLGHRPLTRSRFNRYTARRAWQVLASAGPAEKAADWISDRGSEVLSASGTAHSPFARALIDALSPNAGIDVKPRGKSLGDGIITSFELFLFLHEQVESLTRQDQQFKPQNPDLFPMGKQHDGGQFVFCDPRFPLNQLSWAKRRGDNPYKGLMQFDIADSGFYFGRETDLDALLHILQLGKKQTDEDRPEDIPEILLITGSSGSGKSSLVKAGLLPRFLEAGYEIFQLRPGTRPFQLLQYQEQKSEEPEGETNLSWQAVGGLDQLAALDPTREQVLYLDQYEEIFTECTPQERQQLEAALLALFGRMLDASGPVALRMVLSMRSDFEWQLELSDFGRQFWGLKAYTRLYRLAALGLDDLRSALVNPGLLLGYEFEASKDENLEDLILADLNYQTNPLPLLSYTMQEFVQVNRKKRSDRRKFTISTYREQLGGVSGVLSKKMDELYRRFGEEDAQNNGANPKQYLMKHLFLRMVRLNDGEYSRRRVFRPAKQESEKNETPDELLLADQPKKQGLVDEILAILEKEQMISIGGDQGRRYLEPMHDALINQWSQGLQWIQEFGQENLVLQRQLWEATLEHHRQQQKQSALQRTALWDTHPKLGQVIGHIADSALLALPMPEHQAHLTALGEQLKGADRLIWEQYWQTQQADKKMPSLETLIVTGISEQLLAFFLAIGDHWLNRAEANFIQLSWQQRTKGILSLKKERDEAKAVALAAKAQQMRATDPTVALNLALAAYRSFPNVETAGVFRDIYTDPQNAYYGKWFQETSAVYAVAFSPDGQRVATGNYEGTIGLWDITSGEEVNRFRGHKWPVRCLAFSPDGTYLASGTAGVSLAFNLLSAGDARLWHVQRGEEIRTFQLDVGPFGYNNVSALAFSPDGQYLFIAQDKIVVLWEVASGNELRQFTGHQYAIHSLAVSGDGQLLVTSSSWKTLMEIDPRGELKIWSVESGSLVKDLALPGGAVNSVVFSPDGKQLLTGSDHAVRLWEIESGTVIKDFPGLMAPVKSVSFSPDGKYILAGSADGKAILWKVFNRTAIKIFLRHGAALHAVAFDPKSRYVLTAGNDQRATLWAIAPEPEISEEQEMLQFTGHNSEVLSTAFSPDGQSVVTGGSSTLLKDLFGWKADELRPGSVKLWDSNTGAEIREFTGHTTSVHALAFSPDGQYLLGGTDDGTTRLWEVSSGREIRCLEQHEGPVYAVAFSQNGRYAFTGGSDRTVRQWEIFPPEGPALPARQVRVFNGHSFAVHCLALSPDGQYLLTGAGEGNYYWALPTERPGGSGEAKLWNLQSGQEIQNFGGHAVAVAFSPDGTHFAIAFPFSIILWPLRSEVEYRRCNTFNAISSMAFLPDGNTLFIGTRNSYTSSNTKFLWEINIDERISFFRAGAELNAMAYSPDGRYLLGAAGNTALLWRNPLACLPPAVYKLNAEERNRWRIEVDY